MESAEMQSYRHVCGRVADPNADICADPNRPGTSDRAPYIFNRAICSGLAITRGIYSHASIKHASRGIKIQPVYSLQKTK